jgi:hypothetical protein
MMENKKVVYGVIGGVTLLASAGIIYYMWNRAEKVAVDDGLSDEDRKCVEAIKKLGPVRKDKNGNLDFEYLLQFCEVVGMHAKAKQEIQKRDIVERRRQALKENDENSYRDLIQQIID